MDATEDQRVINRAGFHRHGGGGREFLVLPEAFKREVCSGLDTKAAEKLLVAHGWIDPGGDGRPTQKPRLPGMGTGTRVYVFTTKMWEGDQ
jgi:putative DNA primase/helicase